MSKPLIQTTHIRPRRTWFHFNFYEIWAHRDLIATLVGRDFSSRFRQTILGPAWYIVQPLSVTLVFSVVFSRMLGVSTSGIPSGLFYLSGLICWNYFSQVLGATGNSFHQNANLFTKVYFPRVIVPIATAISTLIGLVVQLGTFLVMYITWHMTTPDSDLGMTWWVCLLPLAVIQSGCLAVGIGFWMSAISAKYRDFQHTLSLVVQLWLYLTPVAYPLSTVPASWRWLAELNPMTAPIELFREGFFGVSNISNSLLIISAVSTLILVTSGWLAFQRTERTFADIV